MGDDGAVRWTVDGRVARVVIDQPPTNVMGAELILGLTELLDDLDGREVTVAVFRSADPDFFVMHGDVEWLVAVGPHEPPPVTEPNGAAALLQRLSAAPYLSVGVLDGVARGGGCEMLCALDLRIGTPRAVIGQPEVPMGILPGAGGTSRWPRLVGRARALEIILTGRDLAAEEALAVGWLDELVPVEGLDDRVEALVARVGSMPPASVAAVKRVVTASVAVPDEVLRLESEELGRLMGAGAHVEPMRRFLAAGGQTRDVEVGSIEPLLDVMLDDG
jgi:enoyl-CoA hydratase/carnithine racemase